MVEIFFNISHCGLVAHQTLDLLCKLDSFRAVRITCGNLFEMEGVTFPHQGSLAAEWELNFMFKLDTHPAFRSNGQLLLDHPE